MKFKTQENESNTFFGEIMDLIIVCLQFKYAVNSQNEGKFEFNDYAMKLGNDYKLLQKLAIALNPKHTYPTFNIELKAAESVDDLIEFEEKYYNMLKEIGNNDGRGEIRGCEKI